MAGMEAVRRVLGSAVAVSRETEAKLTLYHDLLVKWQKAQNLVAPATLDDIWDRHFADSAQLLPLILADGANQPLTLVDFGSGAGFPGLALSLIAPPEPDLRTHLVEANGRKCAFLRDVARNCGANVEIHNCRIEDFANQSTIPAIDVVTARALKPLDQLLDLGDFAFQQGARGLFLKGRSSGKEIEAARKRWLFEASCFDSLTEREARVISIKNVKPRR